MQRKITMAQRLPRMIAMKVTGTGTAAINIGSFEASITDNGVGDYTLTFVKPFARTPIAVASCMTATCYAEISSCSATAVRVLTKSNANAATDAVFNLIVQGFDAVDEI